MATPIPDLQIFSANHPWFRLCKEFGFGLVLPNGWFGRPYDNIHKLNYFRIENGQLILVFDDEQRLVLESPRAFKLKQVGGLYTFMCLLGSDKVTFEHTSYPIVSGSKKRTDIFAQPHSTVVELCGYFALR